MWLSCGLLEAVGFEVGGDLDLVVVESPIGGIKKEGLGFKDRLEGLGGGWGTCSC